MNKKTRLTILPILGVFFALFLGWSTISGQTIDRFAEYYKEIADLPAGTSFRIVITEEDATNIANEYLQRNYESIQNLMQQAIGIRLDVDNPKIEFGDDMVTASVRGGKSILKVGASIQGTMVWSDNRLIIDVKSVDVPVISVDPATVNSYLHGPLERAVNKGLQYYSVISFDIEDGYAVLEAIKL